MGAMAPIEKMGVSGAGLYRVGPRHSSFFPAPCRCGCISRQKYTPNHSKEGPYARGRGKFNSTHRSPQALQKFSIGGGKPQRESRPAGRVTFAGRLFCGLYVFVNTTAHENVNQFSHTIARDGQPVCGHDNARGTGALCTWMRKKTAQFCNAMRACVPCAACPALCLALQGFKG